MLDSLEKFLNQVSVAAEQSSLVKMTLSKPAQKHDELRNVYVKPVLIKEKRLFAFTYSLIILQKLSSQLSHVVTSRCMNLIILSRC